MTARFLQLHTLTSYSASLLNRDDAGFAKRLPFGGATRTRISSQCLKRHWRTHDGSEGLRSVVVDGAEAPLAVRSRRTFETYVGEPLMADGLPSDVVGTLVPILMAGVLGSSAKAKAKAKGADGSAEDTLRRSMRTEQVTVLGEPELRYFREVIREAITAGAGDIKASTAALEGRLKGHDFKRNLEEIRLNAGLDAALFGRMVTSDILARCDAAVHVAHSFTVHGEAAETDYFSAVDDLLMREDEGELGSGHIGTTELTSGLFYGYVVVDVPLLVSNLTGCPAEAWRAADRTLAGEVVRRLVHLVATVSPGAKRGSTAPYAHAHFVLLESGDAQPRTLANAFLAPVRERPDVVEHAYEALADYMREHDAMYGRPAGRRVALMGGGVARSAVAALTDSPPASVADVARWAASVVA